MCGEIHRLHVHGYPWRCYRDRASGENLRIRIVSILCLIARGAGTSYTKRLLPDFLIPRCVIRLDHLVEAASDDRAATVVERACELLGCIDTRTVGKHLKQLQAAVQAAAILPAERQAMRPELGELPETTPETVPLARLEALCRKESEAALRAGGGVEPISLRHMLQAELWKLPGQKPSSCVSGSPRGP